MKRGKLVLRFHDSQQNNPCAFNVGIGRGLTGATDRWTLKTIIEIPFD